MTWVRCASDTEQAKLESLKKGGISPRTEQRSIAREAVHQHYLSYCQQNCLTDSEEEWAWVYVRTRLQTTGRHEREALYDFWVWYRFRGMEPISVRNRPFIDRAEAERSFVYQFIMGEHGRRVCTIKPTKTVGVTHELDGLFLVVNPGRCVKDLIKIMSFDIQGVSDDNWSHSSSFDQTHKVLRYRYPYQLIETTPKANDTVYAFAVIKDHPRDSEEVYDCWGQTLKVSLRS